MRSFILFTSLLFVTGCGATASMSTSDAGTDTGSEAAQDAETLTDATGGEAALLDAPATE